MSWFLLGENHNAASAHGNNNFPIFTLFLGRMMFGMFSTRIVRFQKSARTPFNETTAHFTRRFRNATGP